MSLTSDAPTVNRNEFRLLLAALLALLAGLIADWIGKAVLAAAGVPLTLFKRILLMTGGQLGMLGIFLLLVLFGFPASEEKWTPRLRLQHWDRRWIWAAPLAALGILGAAGGVTFGWQWAGARLGLAFAEPPNQVLLLQLSRPERAFFMATAILLAPVVEELFFRRVLFGFFRQWVPFGWAAIAAAALFAAAHGSLLQLPGLFLMGFLWQWIDCRTQSLYPSLLLHAASNGWVTLAVLLLPGQI